MCSPLDRVRAAVAARDAADAEVAAAVIAAREAGLTLAKVAEAAGVTRQRVWQIVKAAGREALSEVNQPAATADDTAERSRLEARLAEIDAWWETMVDRFAPEFEPADPQREQLLRNAINGQIRKSVSGKTRAGTLKGSVGRHRGRRELPTVKAEVRLLAEAKLVDCLREHAGEDWAVWADRQLAEGFEIRNRLSLLADSRAGF